jgi:hypothetical protein
MHGINNFWMRGLIIGVFAVIIYSVASISTGAL